MFENFIPELTPDEERRVKALLELKDVQALGLNEQLKKHLLKIGRDFFAELRRNQQYPSEEKITDINLILKEIDDQTADLMSKIDRLSVLTQRSLFFDFQVPGPVIPLSSNVNSGDTSCIPGRYVCDLFGEPSKHEGPFSFLEGMRSAIDQVGRVNPEDFTGRKNKASISGKKETIKIGGKGTSVNKRYYMVRIDSFILGLIFTYELSKNEEASISTDKEGPYGEFFEFMKGCVDCILDEPLSGVNLKNRFYKIKEEHPNRYSLRTIKIKRNNGQTDQEAKS